MYIIQLFFSENKAQAPQYMQAHKDWIQQGFDQGRFLLVGSMQPNKGGLVIAHGCSKDEIESFVQQDPFVQQDIVTAEIIEVSPARADDCLSFLLTQDISS